MKKLITIVAIIGLPLFAQDITNKLGASGNYDITDSSDNVLLRVEENGDVGIGTNFPEANLDVHGTVKVFGALIDTFSAEIVHQANTDGFVIASLQGVSSNSSTTVYGFSDSNSSPSTIIARSLVNISGATLTITMPVKKGDYWKVTDYLGGFNTASAYINWIPLGQ